MAQVAVTKAVRCGGRKSEATCKTSSECEWDTALNKCKQVSHKSPKPVKSPKQQHVVPVKAIKKQMCNLKTKVACVKRSNCTWKNKTCQDKDTTIISPKIHREDEETEDSPNITQADALKQAIYKAMKFCRESKTCGSTITVHPNSYGAKIGYQQFDMYPGIPVLSPDKVDLRNTWESGICKISSINIMTKPTTKGNYGTYDVLEKISADASETLANINAISAKSIMLASARPAVIAILTQALVHQSELLIQVQEDKTPMSKRVRYYGNDKTGMGFFAYDGCLKPGVVDMNILGHKIYNVPVNAQGLDNVLAQLKLSMYNTKTSQNASIQHGTYRTPKSIRDAYVGKASSTEVNVSMMMYLQDAELLDKHILTRILAITKEFDKIVGTELYAKPFVLYHGTTQAIHKSNRMVTSSFLSGTTSVKVAMRYAGSDGIVYVIEVPPKFPFLNFNDRLEQILLPVGTSIDVEKSMMFNKRRFVICKIESNIVDVKPFISIFENPCQQVREVHMSPNASSELRLPDEMARSILPSCIEATIADLKKGSSQFYKCESSEGVYIVKDIVKAKNPIRLLSGDHHVFIRILNELMASVIYKDVYNLDTFEMKLVDKRNQCPHLQKASSFLIASKRIDVLYTLPFNRHATIYDGFFVDCILGNWDVFNNDNFGFINGKPIRTDVGGCMAFRGKGDYNIQYDVNVIPRDHYGLWSQAKSKYRVISRKLKEEPLQYLLSITNVPERLESVKRTFIELVSFLQDASHRTRYVRFIEKIINVVQFRDKWYRENGEKIAREIQNVKLLDIYTTINNANNTNNTNVQSPVAFVMTPRKLQATLAKLNKCAMV